MRPAGNGIGWKSGFGERRRAGARFDIAVVHEEVLHGISAAGTIGFRDKPTNGNAAGGAVCRQQGFGKVFAIDSVNTRKQIAVAGRHHLLFAVFDKPHRHFRVGKRQMVGDCGDRRALRTVGFQKFHARRGVVKQVADDNRCAHGAAGVVE